MKILIIGADGQLGTDIQKAFDPQELIPLVLKDLDITSFDQAKTVIGKHKPDIIINTAAYHNVPQCEKNPEQAFQVNALGVRNLVELSEKNNIKLLHCSTDYVFDGTKQQPYIEDDTPNPLNVYGYSKLAGENFVKTLKNYYLIRLASLFGVAGCLGKGGTNFVESMLSLAQTKPVLQVTSNITSSPTYTYDAALRIKEVIENKYPAGIYHVVNSGQCSWYEFALEIFKQSKLKVKVEPKKEEATQAGVARPLYSVLTSSKLKPLRPWPEALTAYLTERSKQTQ